MSLRISRTLALLVAVFVAMSNGMAEAGPFEDGLAAAQRGDDATAMMLWRPLAEQGNRDAQTGLGFFYREGKGVPQDYKESAKWFRKAAEQGDAVAQYYLGLMHANGQGVSQNYKEAM